MSDWSEVLALLKGWHENPTGVRFRQLTQPSFRPVADPADAWYPYQSVDLYFCITELRIRGSIGFSVEEQDVVSLEFATEFWCTTTSGRHVMFNDRAHDNSPEPDYYRCLEALRDMLIRVIRHRSGSEELTLDDLRNLVR